MSEWDAPSRALEWDEQLSGMSGMWEKSLRFGEEGGQTAKEIS